MGPFNQSNHEAHLPGHRHHSCSCRRSSPLPSPQSQGAERRWPLFLPVLRTLVLALCFLVYSFAFSVMWGPTTFAICFLFNFLAKCLSVWSQGTSMWNPQDAARLNFQDSSTCWLPRKVLAACEITHIRFQRAGVRWSPGRRVETPDKLYLLWWQHMGCWLSLGTLFLPWAW